MADGGEEAVRAAIVAAALAWDGTPYRHQSARRGVGCDCLGLVRGVWQDVYRRAPEPAPAYQPDWAEASGEEQLLAACRRHCRAVKIAAALPGDLLVFRWRPHLPAKHAGILVAVDRFIHAYEGHSVMVSPLVPQWRRRIAAAFAFPPLAAG